MVNRGPPSSEKTQPLGIADGAPLACALQLWFTAVFLVSKSHSIDDTLDRTMFLWQSENVGRQPIRLAHVSQPTSTAYFASATQFYTYSFMGVLHSCHRLPLSLVWLRKSLVVTSGVDVMMTRAGTPVAS